MFKFGLDSLITSLRPQSTSTSEGTSPETTSVPVEKLSELRFSSESRERYRQVARDDAFDHIRNGSEVLDRKSFGVAVGCLQEKLNDWLISTHRGEGIPRQIDISCAYDKDTERVVRQFQKQQGLEVSGKVAQQTVAALDSFG